MAAQREANQMRAPAWKFEWNLNTVAILCGFALSFIGWGYALSEMQHGQDANASSIDRLEKRVSTLETTARILDNHELRITNVEKQAHDAAAAMRSVESAISSLSSDIRVVREILQRLENRSSRSPP